jgi:hypothetical protein
LDKPLITALLILHDLVAVGLLGAVSHQALSVGRAAGATKNSFAQRYRGVDSSAYSVVIVVLFAVVSLMGAVLYPSYRIVVRPVLENYNLRTANGSFEIKEHLSAIGLIMLPAYWAAWKKPFAPEYATARFALTWILAFIVWWNFLTGAVLDNIKGLSG